MRYLCIVPSVMKFPKFPATTALQRKLIVGALDFSPLRHSPALAERHYYTKNRPGGAAKFEEIRTAGV